MKRYLAMFLVLVLAISVILPETVSADVIFEPMNDSFYEAHREECTYVGRYYLSKGMRTVTAYESPESDKVKGYFGVEDRIYISYTCEDSYGVLWGCCENWGTEQSGWVPMDYLQVIYDGISFMEDHGEECTDREGSISRDHQGKTIRFWEYPGSRDAIEIELHTDPDGYLPEYSTVYVDDQGRSWGRCGYYMGIKGRWIQLEDPEADFDTLFPDYVEETAPETGTDPVVAEIVPQEPAAVQNAKVFVSVAVVLTVVVTAALLILLKKKSA